MTLPGDFKELSRRFPAGTFDAYLDLLRAESNPHQYKLLGWHMQSLSRPSSRRFEPSGCCPPMGGPASSHGGWTSARGSTTGWRIGRWIPTSGPSWPEAHEEWHRLDMTASEVVCRVITDPEFQPFTVADPPRRPFYLPAGQNVSVEEWNALSAPDRDT